MDEDTMSLNAANSILALMSGYEFTQKSVQAALRLAYTTGRHDQQRERIEAMVKRDDELAERT